MKKTAFSAACAALLAAGAATAAPAPAPREASIPFANHGGIYDWDAVDRDTLYVQDIHRRWYRAELIGPCLDLDYAQAIGFKVDATDRFDRYSDVIVRGQRCALKSLVASDAPPHHVKKQKS
jgi:hypothetical protein